MIVLDENIHSRQNLASIAEWYRGQVVSVTQLRPGSVIRDDAIPALLQRLNQPTFVTTNVDDFWQIVQPHSAYCIVCLSLPRERNGEVPTVLRQLFALSEFRTKALRMGKVVRSSVAGVFCYDQNRVVREILGVVEVLRRGVEHLGGGRDRQVVGHNPAVTPDVDVGVEVLRGRWFSVLPRFCGNRLQQKDPRQQQAHPAAHHRHPVLRRRLLPRIP